MHHFGYQKKGKFWLLQDKIESQYPWLLLQWLSEESIQARYFLLEYLHQKFQYTWSIHTSNHRPEPIKIGDHLLYWSISHSENYIAFIVWTTEVAIDITEVRPRSTALLDIHSNNEYLSLGRGKTWGAFFILWTAKEVVIKLENITLDTMPDIQLREITPDGMTMMYDRHLYTIRICEHEDIILAYGSSEDTQEL